MNDNLKKAVDFLGQLGSIGDAVGRASGYAAKLAALLPLIGDVSALASIDWADAKAALKGLDREGTAALLAEFKSQFSIADEGLEQKIEAGLDLAVEVWGTVDEVIAFIESFKSAPQA